MKIIKRYYRVSVITAYILIICWGLIIGTDYIRSTKEFVKPLFTIKANNNNSDLPIKYIGLGYTVETNSVYSHSLFTFLGVKIKDTLK